MATLIAGLRLALKRIVFCFLFLLVLLPASVTLIVYNMDIEDRIGDYVEYKTGRKLSISDAGISWGLSPRIYFEDVALENAAWGTKKQAFTAQQVRLTFSLGSLLQGKLEISEMEINSPVLQIEKNRETGLTNFNFGSDRGNTDRPDISIGEMAITDGVVLYITPAKHWQVNLQSAMLFAPSNREPITGLVKGDIQGVPVMLSGTIGSLSNILNEDEITVDLKAKLPGESSYLSISGIVSNLIRWRGLSLWFKGNLQKLDDLSGIWDSEAVDPKVISDLNVRDITASWELSQPGILKTLRLGSLNVQGTVSGINTDVTGEISQLVDMKGVIIDFEARGSPNIEAPYVKPLTDILQSPESALVSAKGRLSGDRGRFSLNLQQLSVHSGGAGLSTAGIINPFSKVWENSLPLRLELDHMKSIWQTQSEYLQLLPNVVVETDLIRSDSGYDLENIKGKVLSGSMEVSLNGHISNFGQSQNGELKLDISANNEYFQSIKNIKALSLIDQLSGAGSIVISEKGVSVRDIEVEAKAAGINFQGRGYISDLVDAELSIDIDGEIDNLQRLGTVIEKPLPDTETVFVNMRLENSADGNLNLSNINAVTDSAGFSARLSGTMTDLGPQQSIDLTVVGEVRDSTVIEPLLTTPLLTEIAGHFSPLVIRGNIKGRIDQGISLQGLEIKSSSGEIKGLVSGEIRNLFSADRQGFLDVEVDGRLSKGSQQQQTVVSKLPFQLKGDLSGALKVSIVNNVLSLEGMSVNLKNQTARLSATGGIQQFSPLITDDLVVKLEAERFGDIFKMREDMGFNQDIGVSGVLDFSHSEGAQHINLSVKLAASDLTGKIDIQPRSEMSGVSSVDARFSSNNLDLEEIFIESVESDRVLSDNPFNLQWMDRYKGMVTLEVSRFRNDHFTLENIEVTNRFDAGMMEVVLDSDSDQGALDIALSMKKEQDSLNPGFYIKLDINAEKMDMAIFNAAISSKGQDSGTFNARIDISGWGDSIAELAKEAKGEMMFQVTGAKLKSQGLELASDDLLYGILSFINPLDKKRELVHIDCGVVLFEVANGKAITPRGLAVKTDNFTVIGGGSIDLDDESIKFLVSSKARKGLGINTNTVAKLVNVSGTLGKPQIKPSAEGLLQTGAALGAAIFSGGLSLLFQGVYDRFKANSDVCEVVLSVDHKTL